MNTYLLYNNDRNGFFFKRNLNVGDLVLFVNESAPRGQWQKGIVEETFLDKHGDIRQCEVRTALGTFRRDVRKLCFLEGDQAG